MSRPTPLEIQDALYGGALRTAAYVTAAIALVALVAPWEAGPDGTRWTWDLWSGSEPFFLLPVIGGVILAVLGAVEAVPGFAVGAFAAVAGLAWTLVCGSEFEPIYLRFGAAADDRLLLAQVAVPLLLAGLAYRRALHRSLVARLVLAAGALATIALFVVPMGDDGTTLVQAGILGPFGSGELLPALAAVPLALLALAAVGGLAALLPSPRSTGGLSSLVLVLFHVTAAAVAFGHLLPFVAGLGHAPALSYGLFAVPLKLGGLWWVALVWIGLGAGTTGGAVEALLRREPLPGTGQGGRKPVPTPALPARPIAVGQAVVLPGSPAAAGTPAPLDLSAPLPPPPGLAAAAADGVPPHLHSKEPSEVVELAAQHALPILDAHAPARSAEPLPLAVLPVAALPVAALPVAPLPVAPVPVAARPPILVGRPKVSTPALPPAPPAPPVPPAAPAPSATERAAPAPLPSRPAAAAAAPRAAYRARTQLGMPSVPPGMVPGRSGSTAASPDESGRTGDTSLGLPVMKRTVGGDATTAPPAPERQEVSGLRFWPPPEGSGALPPSREAPATPAFGVEIMRDVAMHDSTMRQTPAIIPPTAGMKKPSTAVPAPVRLAAPDRPAPAEASGATRQRISTLQRQLARGEITQEQYQQRLDEMLKPGRPR